MLEKPRIAKLAKQHDTSNFACGNAALNDFIRLHAFTGQRANVSQTYVAAVGDCVDGYHTLGVGNVSFADASERLD
jgi:hypothetical protein